MRYLASIILASVIFSSLEAREYISKVKKYIHKDTNQILELDKWDLSSDGTTNKYFNHKTSQWVTINMSDYAVETSQEISGIRKKEYILYSTKLLGSRDGGVERLCLVHQVFENSKAHVGCKTYAEDKIMTRPRPRHIQLIVSDLEAVIPEVKELEGVRVGEVYENLKSGTQVRALALMADGRVIVQRKRDNFLDSSEIIFRDGIEVIPSAELRPISP
jgi:hypothetical protein